MTKHNAKKVCGGEASGASPAAIIARTKMTVNEIASAYPKDNHVPTVGRWLEQRLRNANNAKRPEWQRFTGVQFPQKIPTRSVQAKKYSPRKVLSIKAQLGAAIHSEQHGLPVSTRKSACHRHPCRSANSESNLLTVNSDLR